MGAIKTLAGLQKKIEKTGGSGNNFLTLKDGDSYQIRFLQELSEDGKNFSEDRGTAELVAVHANPINFRRKMACTAETGACWACEQIADNSKWRATNHLLINVAYKDGGDFKVGIVDTTFSKAKIGDTMVECASEFGTLTSKYYKFKRTGAKMNDTAYTLMGLSDAPADDEVTEPLNDLTTVYKVVPYEQQEEWLTKEEVANAKADSW